MLGGGLSLALDSGLVNGLGGMDIASVHSSAAGGGARIHPPAARSADPPPPPAVVPPAAASAPPAVAAGGAAHHATAPVAGYVTDQSRGSTAYSRRSADLPRDISLVEITPRNVNAAQGLPIAG